MSEDKKEEIKISTNAPNAAEIKAEVDAAIDDCFKRIKEAYNKFTHPQIQVLVYHRIVLYLWVCANKPVFEQANQQARELDQLEKLVHAENVEKEESLDS